MTMENLFYELMQVAVGQLDCLSRGPSPEEWHALYQTARQQSVTGVCYKGVERLFEFGLRGPQDVSIDWMSEAEDIREANETTDKRSTTILAKLSERKIYSTLVLGQGVARDYDADIRELRQPNGIDVFVDCGWQKAVKFVQQTGQQEVRHRHQAVWLLTWQDTPVRLRTQVVYCKNPWKNAVVHQWFRQNRECLFTDSNGMTTPTADMNIVIALLTLYNAMMYERVDMRMLMDCFFILKKKNGSFGMFKGGMTAEKVMRSFGMLSFSRGVMWIMQEVFGMRREQLPFNPNETEGRFVLRQVMEGRHVWQLCKHYPFQMIWNIK